MAGQAFAGAFGHPPEDWAEWVTWLQIGLHGRSCWRLPLVLTGLLMARGRRTVSSWLRAAQLQADYIDYYYFNGSVGRKSKELATRLFQLLLSHLPLPERIVLALDDTPTARYGPKVEGAGLHHNPTSGPDDHKFVYGHVWVTLAWVVRDPLWHTLGLPLLSRLYVKAKDVPPLAQRYGWVFQTKLQLAIDLVQWAANTLKPSGKPIWLVMDGAYAYRPLLKPILAMGITVVSRLRRDAGLRRCPQKRRGQRGKRKYGKEKISLAKRAAHRPVGRPSRRYSTAGTGDEDVQDLLGHLAGRGRGHPRGAGARVGWALGRVFLYQSDGHGPSNFGVLRRPLGDRTHFTTSSRFGGRDNNRSATFGEISAAST